MAVQIYCDESGTHADSPVISMAGVGFEDPAQVKKFQKSCDRLYSEHGIEYFHMTDCANRARQFGNKSARDCDQIARAFIKINRERAAFWLACSLKKSDFDAVFNKEAQIRWGGPYTFLTQMLMYGAGSWAEKKGYAGQIAYVYEAGHASANEASEYLNIIAASKHHAGEREKYRYVSHSFIQKTAAAPLHGADMFAWHWRKQCLREEEGKPIRKDLRELAKIHHLTMKYDQPVLKQIMSDTLRLQSSAMIERGYSLDSIKKELWPISGTGTELE